MFSDNYFFSFSYPRFRDKLGVKVVRALKRNDDGVNHAAIDMLCALMQVLEIKYTFNIVYMGLDNAILLYFFLPSAHA